MNSLTKILRLNLKVPLRQTLINNQAKYSSFRGSPFVQDLQPTVKYEITKDPAEWAFVERLLPPQTITKPILQDEYPSNWKPQSVEALKQPYFIRRSRNHMLPVYLETTFRGQRRITKLRYIDGDIWQLEKDLKEFLQATATKPIRTQIHEFAGFILVHGDHVNAIKHWLQEKHF